MSLDDAGMTERRRRLWAFLCHGFRREMLFWEMVVVLRKIGVVALQVFGSESALLQTYGAIWLVSAALAAQVAADPFLSKMQTRLEISSLAVIFISFQVGCNRLFSWSGWRDIGGILYFFR